MHIPHSEERPYVNIYDDLNIESHLGVKKSQFLWPTRSPDEISDIWSAARYCMDILRGRPDLQKCFPRALSDGRDGDFARWLLRDRERLLPSALRRIPQRLSSRMRGGAERVSLGRRPRIAVPFHARRHIAAAFACLGAGRAGDVVLSRPDVMKAFPLGFTPVGHADLLLWFVNHGCREERVRLEEVWWFLLTCAEDRGGGIPLTYRFTEAWQAHFPDGMTVFGGQAFGAWLTESYGVPRTLADPSNWTDGMSPAQQIRLAYRHRENWQVEHPHAFSSVAQARALLAWLKRPQAQLPVEARAWCSRLDIGRTAEELAQPGMNILGHFCYPSGLRTSAEAIAGGLHRCGVGVSLRDVRSIHGDEPRHSRYGGLEIYETTLVHVQPEPLFDTAFRRAGLFAHTPRPHSIGYWYWELDDVPAGWAKQADTLDEVWTATTFVAEALRRRLRQPVLTMLPGLELPAFTIRPRAYFGLPGSGEFVFVFVFHMSSVMERKNPLGLIAAFRAAFRADEPVRLVLKTSFGEQHPGPFRALHEAAAGHRITVIDRVYDAGDVISLMQAADCYVSLHRSEGLGLTMAEAMLLAKPVIATGYSGNTDFMDHGNSLLVNHTLVTLERNFAPYEAGAHWAEPSAGHAARLMRRAYENPSWAAELGMTARRDAQVRMSLAASGQRMKARLMQIAAGANGIRRDGRRAGQPAGVECKHTMA